MNTTDKIELTHAPAMTALECDFPLIEISQIAEQESWRKEINRPIYHIHKWWATRLLKDDGVLAFSFHHSRAEGWAAIHEAINKAGLAVVAAHPVHAELRAASPKTSTKEPISLDAILVCRKKAFALHQPSALQNVLVAVDTLSARLQAAGLSISAGDRFVIGATHTLIVRAADDLSFDEINMELSAIRLAVGLTDGEEGDKPVAAEIVAWRPNDHGGHRPSPEHGGMLRFHSLA